jgi:hypothetical protein
MTHPDAALIAALEAAGAVDSRICGCGGNGIIGCSLHPTGRSR